MKIIDSFFQPYEEFSIRTALSEEELKQALEKECPDSSALSWKVFKASFGMSETMIFIRRHNDPFRLFPVRSRRNSMRGEVHIQCEKISDGVTVLHISIAPDGRWKGFIWGLGIFSLIYGIFAAMFVWYLVFLPVVFFGFMFFVLTCCCGAAQSEVSETRQGFRELLKKLEHNTGG